MILMLNAWGDFETHYFFELTPEKVLESVEETGLRCTGRCFALNSFENRVYDVEMEDENEKPVRRVIKFYRPGRWSIDQIQEEHQFLLDLQEAEVPVVNPLSFSNGQTVHQTDSGIYYSVFPRVGGRSPDELSDEQLIRIGRFLGRLHNVGAQRKAQFRIQLNSETYGYSNLEYLLKDNKIPNELIRRYESAAIQIFKYTDDIYRELSPSSLIRLHGDCHLGNLLWSGAGPFFLDFDDMVVGPPVQDIWLLIPGRDEESIRQRNLLIEGYEEIRHFDRTSLRLIECLRALRFIHYSAWIARRWKDPAFPLAFPHFGTHQYWSEEVRDLEKQYTLIDEMR